MDQPTDPVKQTRKRQLNEEDDSSAKKRNDESSVTFPTKRKIGELYPCNDRNSGEFWSPENAYDLDDTGKISFLARGVDYMGKPAYFNFILYLTGIAHKR